MTIRRLIAALVSGFFVASAAHAGSTVNPTLPAQNAPLNSAPVRNNFLAAYTDINNLLGQFAGPTAPVNPTNLQSWADTTATPVYVFKYWNARTSTWVPYGQLNINTGVFTPYMPAGSFAATSPLTVTNTGSLVTYGLSLGGNFAATGGALHLANTPAANLICNATGSSAEPSACSWTSFADAAISNVNNAVPTRSGGVWGSILIGTSGHKLPTLDGAGVWSAAQTINLNLSAIPGTLIAGTVLNLSDVDGNATRGVVNSYGSAARWSTFRRDGTAASPVAVGSGADLGGFSSFGYDGTANADNSIAGYLRFFTAEGWTSTAHGSRACLATVALGTTSVVDGLCQHPSAGVTIGSPTGGDQGTGTLNLAGLLYANGTAPTGTGAYVRSASPSLTTPSLGVANATSVLAGQGLGNQVTASGGTTGTNPSLTVSSSAGNLNVGLDLVTLGSGAVRMTALDMAGSTSGTASVRSQAAAGSPTIYWPTTSGTLATSATAPIVLNSTTGVLTCPTCVTSSGGGSLVANAPLNFNAGTSTMSITGAAGMVMAGASPAFTANPTLGVAGSMVGTIAFANATSGTVTVQPATGALGSSVLTMPAATDTFAVLAASQTLTNKTISGASNTLTVLAGSQLSGVTPAANGGTGVANSSTITIGGNVSTASTFTTSGAFGLTLTSTGTTNATLPAGSHTLGALDVAQTWSAAQSFGSGNIKLNGATSGALTVNCAATCGTNTLTLPAGTTDFSATGGASQVVRQTTAGGALTVGQLAFSDISGTAAVAQLPAGTNAAKGVVQCDGTTINCTGGVITAVGAAATSIGVGTTTVSAGTSNYLLYNNAGTLGNGTMASFLTAGSGITLSGATNVTITNASASVSGAIKSNGSGAYSQAGASDLSNGVTGSGAVALATSPSFTTPSLGAATATSLTNSGNSKAATFATSEIDYQGSATSYTVPSTSAVILFAASSTVTVTLPNPSDIPGRILHLITIGGGAIQSASSNVGPIAGGSLGTSILSSTPGKWAILSAWPSGSSRWQIIAAN